MAKTTTKSKTKTKAVTPAVKTTKTKEEREKELAVKYPTHKIVDGSLLFNEEKQKLSVRIVCQHPGCKAERVVFTSDLFQVKMCENHTKQARKAKMKAKRAAAREALKAATPKA